jgi:hypothetical protein
VCYVVCIEIVIIRVYERDSVIIVVCYIVCMNSGEVSVGQMYADAVTSVGNDEMGVMRERMVYCTKCGTNNVENAEVCVNCGTPLFRGSGEGRAYVRHGRYERGYGARRRSGRIVGIVIGLIVIFAGFSLLVTELYGIEVPWLPITFILFGAFILVRWFQLRNRRR